MKKSNTLYVGGLAPEVTEDIFYAAFLPFGSIKEVQIPKDYQQNKMKGFGFVEYEEDDDCLAALENMDGSELFGKVLRCSIAKPLAIKSSGKSVAIWSTDEWMQKQIELDEIDDVASST